MKHLTREIYAKKRIIVKNVSALQEKLSRKNEVINEFMEELTTKKIFSTELYG